MKTNVLALAAFWLSVIGGVALVNSQCATSDTNVVLNNCALPSFNFTNTSLSLNVTFRDYTWNFPTFSIATKSLVIGDVGVTTQTSPHLGVLRIPKGVNITVILKNVIAASGIPTNLHTHGLHIYGGDATPYVDDIVKPSFTSDDVSVEVLTGEEHTYEYFLPSDHAGGVHWMHPHVHMHTEAQVSGGAVGMIIVEDAAGGVEIPSELSTNMPIHEMIFFHFDQARARTQALNHYVTTTSGTAATLYTVNGFVNPKLQVEQGVWTRLRMLHASPVQMLFTTFPATCIVLLLGKDGVYVKPREITSKVIQFTQASRVEILIKCSGAVGSSTTLRTANSLIPVAPTPPGGPPAPPTPPDLDLFQLVIVAKTTDQAWLGNLDAVSYTPCKPFYLQDLFDATVYKSTTMQMRGPPANTLNGNSFSSFSVSSSYRNLSVGTVEQWTIDGVNHPIHVHLYPMQIQADVDSWTLKGDWLDVVMGKVAPFPVVRTLIDQHIGVVVVHCHILGHEDGGLMGVMYAFEDGVGTVRADAKFGVDVCTSKVNIETRSPSKNPSRNPSRNPTRAPTKNPSRNPTPAPSNNPTNPTRSPSANPSMNPTNPTISPSRNPSKAGGSGKYWNGASCLLLLLVTLLI